MIKQSKNLQFGQTLLQAMSDQQAAAEPGLMIGHPPLLIIVLAGGGTVTVTATGLAFG
jgi:hypothetical protein